jgi:hypothetical protein
VSVVCVEDLFAEVYHFGVVVFDGLLIHLDEVSLPEMNGELRGILLGIRKTSMNELLRTCFIWASAPVSG